MSPTSDPVDHFFASFAEVRAGVRTAEDFLADARSAGRAAAAGPGHTDRLTAGFHRLLPELPAADAVLLARGLVRHAIALRRDHPREARTLIEAALPTIRASATAVQQAWAQLQLGITLARLDEFDAALAALDALPPAPADDDDVAWVRVGAGCEKAAVLERAGRLPEAVACSEAAVGAGLDLAERGSPAVHLGDLVEEARWLVGVRSDLGQPADTQLVDRVIDALRRPSAPTSPEHLAEALRLRASLRADADRTDQAVADYEEAGEILGGLIAGDADAADRGRLEDDLVTCLTRRANLVWEWRDGDAAVVAVYDEALPLFRRRAETDDLLIGLNRRAYALWRLDRNAEAVADCDEGLAVPAADGDGLRLRLRLTRAAALLDLHWYDDVVATCDEALALPAVDSGEEDRLVWAHYRRAVALHHLGRHEDAVAGFDAALPLLERRESAALGPAERRRAASLAALSRHDDAATGFHRAVRFYRLRDADGDDLLECLLGRADSLAELFDHDDAMVAVCDEALPLLRRRDRPGDIKAALRRRAAARGRLGRAEGALEDWDELLGLEASAWRRVDILDARAKLLLGRKRYADALDSCDAALALAPSCPDDPDVWGPLRYRRGEVLFYLGRWAEAVAEFDRAVPLLDRSEFASAFTLLAPKAVHIRALALAILDDDERAAAGFDDAADRYERDGEVRLFGECKRRAGDALVRLNRSADALDRFDAAFDALCRGEDEEALTRCLVRRSRAQAEVGRDVEAGAGFYAAIRRLHAAEKREKSADRFKDVTAMVEAKHERAEESVAASARLVEALTRLVPELADPPDDAAREAAWRRARERIQPAWEALQAVLPPRPEPPATSLPDAANAEAGERFGRRDYYGCGRMVAAAPNGRITFLVGLLLLVSSRRLGEDIDAEDAAKIIDGAATNGRERDLLRLASGGEVDDDLLATAGSDAERCRVLFCLGERALTLGDVDAARRAFRECAEVPAACPERWLAQLELNPESDLEGAPARAEGQARVYGLVREAAGHLARGETESALAAARRACAGAERDLAAGDLLRAECEYTLGVLLLDRGEVAAAEPPLRQSLAALGRLELLGHAVAVRGLNALALLCQRAGRWAEAGRLAERAVEAARTGLARDTGEYVTALVGLARADVATGRPAAAAVGLCEAVRVVARLDPFNGAGYGATVHNLACLYVAAGNPPAAARLLRDAVGVTRRRAGDEGRLYAALTRTRDALAEDLGRSADGPRYTSFAEAVDGFAEPDTNFLFWGWAVCRDAPEVPTTEDSERAEREPGAGARVEAWYDRAVELGEAGRHDEAARAAGEGVELARALLGPGRPDSGYCLRRRADALEAAGDEAGALACWEEALAAFRRAFGECHRAVRGAWYHVARLLCRAGRREEAERHLVRCVAVDRALGPVREAFLADALGELGSLRDELGRPGEAVPPLEEAFVILSRVRGEAHADTLRNVLRVASPMSALGLDADARLLLTRSLEVCLRTRGEADLLTADFRQRIGSAFLALHDHAGARPHLRAAYDTRRAGLGDDDPRTRESFDSLYLAVVTHGAAEDDPLIQELTRRLVAYGERYLQHDTDAPDAHKIRVFHRMGTMLHGIARHERTAEKYRMAQYLFDRALGMAAELHGWSAPITILLMRELARVAYDLGDAGGAAALLRRACERPGGRADLEAQTAVMTELACYLVAAGEAGDAEPLLFGAAMMTPFRLALVRAGTTDHQRELYMAQVQMGLAVLLSFAARGTGFLLAPDEVYKSVLGCKGVVLEAAMSTRATILTGRHPHMADDLAALVGLQEEVARLTLAGAAAGGRAAHQEQLAEARARCDRLATNLAANIPELRFEQASSDIDLGKVAAALPAGSVLVEFIRYTAFEFTAVPAEGQPRWGPPRYVAFVMPAGDEARVRMVDLGDAEAIDRLIDRFRAGFSHSGGRELVADDDGPPEGSVGPELRTAVFDRLEPALEGRDRLVLAPDGHLAQLPFEVLPWSDGRLLIDGYRISYVGTGRDVLRFGRSAGDRRSAPLVVAAPDYDLGATAAPPAEPPPGRRSRDLGVGGLWFCELPNTRTEGAEVARLLGGRLLTGAAAVKQSVKAMCRGAASGGHPLGSPPAGPVRPPFVLHLATHGFFLKDQPGTEGSGWDGRLTGSLPENPLLRAGLALAGANAFLAGGSAPAEAEDGLLTAEDVAAMDLLGTELVVLSACDTALGEVRAGEGVFGLQRAFLLAGAKTLIMSLWKVPDDVTSELMVGFYRRLLDGETGRAEALRLAQQEVRERHRDPYYWGAFICLGDPAPLPTP